MKLHSLNSVQLFCFHTKVFQHQVITVMKKVLLTYQDRHMKSLSDYNVDEAFSSLIVKQLSCDSKTASL